MEHNSLVRDWHATYTGFDEIFSKHPGLIEFLICNFKDRVNPLYLQNCSIPKEPVQQSIQPSDLSSEAVCIGNQTPYLGDNTSGLPFNTNSDLDFPPLSSNKVRESLDFDNDNNCFAVPKGYSSEFHSGSIDDVQRRSPQKLGSDPVRVSSTVEKEDQPSLGTDNKITPVKKGDFYSITISEDFYRDSIKLFEGSLIGRVTYSKGEKPVSTMELRRKLEDLWNIKGNIRLIPLGRGYFNIQFDREEDSRSAFLKNSWFLKPGLLCIQKWVSNFNPYRVKSSVAQVWVRVFELPIEYWRQEIFDAIASAIGTLIRVDDRTLSKDMCHYVRMLVEVDLKNPLHDRIMFERPGYCSFAYFQYESLPTFCTTCCVIGHSVANCNISNDKEMFSPRSVSMPKKEAMEKGPQVVKEFQRMKDGPRENVQQRPFKDSVTKGVALSNSFDVLVNDVEQPVTNREAVVPQHSEILTEKQMDVSGVLGVPVRSILKQKPKLAAAVTDLQMEDDSRKGLKDTTSVAPPKFYPIALCARLEDSPARRRKFGSVKSQVLSSDEHLASVQNYSNFTNSKQPP